MVRDFRANSKKMKRLKSGKTNFTQQTSSAATSNSEDSENASTPKQQKEKQYKHKFNAQWLKQFSWLKKTENAFCQCCTTTLVGSITHITRHEATERHKNNLKKVESTPKIENYLENDEKILHHNNIYASELKLVMFLHEHNLPFLLMDHLPKLLHSVCPDSVIAKSINCGRTKSTALTTECIANESLEVIRTQLNKDGSMYSLIIDETTDVSLKKCLAVVLRFCHNNKSRDRFLGLIRVESATAESLFNAVLKLLENSDISISKMIGLAADNASVMMGQKAGVQAKFKELNEDLYVLGCTCHSLHLCSSAACTKLPKSIEEFVRSLYNHFSNSPKRTEKFEEFQKFLELEPHKMLRSCQTRWLSLQAVVDRILLLWESLKLYFTNLVFEKNELLHMDNVLLENLRNPVYKAYLIFLSYILDVINQMNLQFQSESIQIHMLYTKFTVLYKTLLKNFVKKSVLENTDLINICPSNPDIFLLLSDIYMGAKVMLFLEENMIENQELEKFRVNILAFYVELCLQIRKRFKFDDKYLIFLTNLQPKVVMSGTIPSVHQASYFFKKVIMDVEKLNHEWRLLPEIDGLKQLSNSSFEDFWQEVFKIKNELNQEMFPNLTKLIKAVMCLPHSSAAAERIFSKLNLIKTDLRNRLTVENCSAIMLSSELLYEEKCFTWQPSARLLKLKPKYV